MWPQVVIVLAEGFEDLPCVVDIEEQVFVEALVAELAVEAFVERVLSGFPRRDEAMVDFAVMGPSLQGDAGKLGPIVGQQTGGPSAQFYEVIEDSGDPGPGKRGVGLDPQAFAGTSTGGTRADAYV